jgi:hypothetical protein
MATKPPTHSAMSSGQRLWTLYRGDRSFGVELHRADREWDVLFFNEGTCFATQRVCSRELAVLTASFMRADLKRDGWVDGPSQPTAAATQV